MVMFILTTSEDNRKIRIKSCSKTEVPENRIGKTYSYTDKDEIVYTVEVTTDLAARAIEFVGIVQSFKYTWMINSIITFDTLLPEAEVLNKYGSEAQRKLIPIFENSELSFDRTYNHISGWLANITELKSLIDKSYIDYNLPCTKFNKSIGKLTDEISKEIIEIEGVQTGLIYVDIYPDRVETFKLVNPNYTIRPFMSAYNHNELIKTFPIVEALDESYVVYR